MEGDVTTDTARFSFSPFSHFHFTAFCQSVSVKQQNKKYDLKFKLSVIKYAEENSGEAAARCFSVDPKRERLVKKSNRASASVQGGQQQDQAACWREEEGERGA